MNTPPGFTSTAIPASLWAGALSQVLSFSETGCPHSARRAADLLDRLADNPQLDGDIRDLCERAARRFDDDSKESRRVSR
jgi:hypothetical protein